VRALILACLGLLPVTVAGLVYEAATAGGFGLREAADPSVLRAVLGTTFGTVWGLRAGLAVLLAGILLASRRFARETSPWLRGCIALCGVAVAVSTTGASHAWAEGRFAMLADGAHLLAAAIWTGGLVSLILVLRQAPAGDRWRLAARIVPRFSTLAVGAVAVLVLAGIGSAYVEVGAWRGLWDTTYGQLVIGKAALLVPLVGLGAFNNRVAVPRLRRGIASAHERQRFARTVAAEVCLMLAALGLTAALVQQRPARSSLTAAGPYSATSRIGPYELDLVVDPARVGRGQIHLYLLDRSGQPARGIAEVRLAASLARPQLGPLRFSTTPAGPGHFIAPSTQFPIAGSWRLTTQVRRGEFDQWSVTTTLPIR
jgi:copper transport protein